MGAVGDISKWAFGCRLPEFKISQEKRRSRVPEPKAGSRTHFFLPPSSAMYMISCLKMNRLGAPSRVSRTIFLS